MIPSNINIYVIIITTGLPAVPAVLPSGARAVHVGRRAECPDHIIIILLYDYYIVILLVASLIVLLVLPSTADPSVLTTVLHIRADLVLPS